VSIRLTAAQPPDACVAGNPSRDAGWHGSRRSRMYSRRSDPAASRHLDQLGIVGSFGLLAPCRNRHDCSSLNRQPQFHRLVVDDSPDNSQMSTSAASLWREGRWSWARRRGQIGPGDGVCCL